MNAKRHSLLTPHLPGKGRTVALVLGSGGARGYAHIGAIEVLLERGYEIVAIAGCSMGALIGGIYATGRLQDYKDWVTGLGQFDVLKLLDISLSSPGAIRGEKIFSIVNDLIGDVRIEDLSLSYTAVATDLLAHKEIWFQEGPLHQAIRASVAIPSLLTPVLLGGRVLVDGGVLNPLPIIPTIASHADLIIAVNLSGEDAQPFKLVEEESSHRGNHSEEWLEKIREKTARWFDLDTWRSLSGRSNGHRNAVEETAATPTEVETTSPPADQVSEEASDEGAKQDEEMTILDNNTQLVSASEDEKSHPINWHQLGLGKFDIMNLTFETMQSALTQYKLAGYPPDVLIDIPKHACRSFDYHKAPEMIQMGRERTEAALDRLLHGQMIPQRWRR